MDPSRDHELGASARVLFSLQPLTGMLWSFSQMSAFSHIKHSECCKEPVTLRRVTEGGGQEGKAV